MNYIRSKYIHVRCSMYYQLLNRSQSSQFVNNKSDMVPDIKTVNVREVGYSKFRINKNSFH